MLSCEKDDICSADTLTTPKLILRFYDKASPDEILAVPDLRAYALDDDGSMVEFLGITTNTKDSLAIPLQTEMNETRIVLQRNFDSENPDDGNADTIDIRYEREDIYVSRACGYKAIFNNLIFSVTNDTDNWIVNSEVLIDTVDNQIQAHVKILH